MSPKLIELALAKQRLQMQSAAHRDALATAAMGLTPLFAAADAVRDGGRWLARNPQWLAGAIVVFLVARPQRITRWARRGFLAWQAWRRVSQWRLEQADPQRGAHAAG